MNKIKKAYWILTGVFAILTLVVIFYISQDGWTNTLLSGTAICVSILAMGLSDKKINYFEGEVHLWNVAKSKSADHNHGQYHISMKILNMSKSESVMDVVYRLRLPSKISTRIIEKNSSAREFMHGYSKIIIDDTFGFLGITNNENFIPIDLKIKLDEWKSGDFFITISGSNINPTTFKLSSDQVDKLKHSNNSSPIKASIYY